VASWRFSSDSAVGAVERQRKRDRGTGLTLSVVKRHLFLADDELTRRLDQPQTVQLRVGEVADRARRQRLMYHLQPQSDDDRH